jgi:hypothetical protein
LIYDTDTTLTRLWLTEIKETAGSETNSYILEYNDYTLLPAFDSPSDDWGYIKSSNPSLCGLNIPSNAEVVTGLLKSITLPTGGQQEFEFERHKITYQGNSMLTDQEYRDVNPDNWIPQSNSYSFDTTSGTSSGDTLGTLVIQTQEQEVIFNRTNISGTSQIQFNSYIELTDTNGYRSVFRLNEEEVKFTLAVGTYTVKFFTFNTSPVISGSFCFGYKTFTPTVYRYVYGGGVRIKNIHYRDTPDTQIPPVKSISYGYDAETVQNTSSGAIDGLFSGLIKKI